MDIFEIIKTENDRILTEEGITQQILDMVDLDIEFSPVICFRGETECSEVRKTEGGKYLVAHPMMPEAVSAECLKPMRARFLLCRDKDYLMEHNPSALFSGFTKQTFRDIADMPRYCEPYREPPVQCPERTQASLF